MGVRYRGAMFGSLVATLVVAAPGPLGAQELVRDPGAIAACICSEQRVAALSDELAKSRSRYEERRNALAQLDAEVESRRPQVNVTSQSDIAAFKTLLARRDDAEAQFAGEVTKSYADSVQGYNAAVASYNGTCAGKALAPDVASQIRPTLSCPKP